MDSRGLGLGLQSAPHTPLPGEHMSQGHAGSRSGLCPCPGPMLPSPQHPRVSLAPPHLSLLDTGPHLPAAPSHPSGHTSCPRGSSPWRQVQGRWARVLAFPHAAPARTGTKAVNSQPSQAYERSFIYMTGKRREKQLQVTYTWIPVLSLK